MDPPVTVSMHSGFFVSFIQCFVLVFDLVFQNFNAAVLTLNVRIGQAKDLEAPYVTLLTRLDNSFLIIVN